MATVRITVYITSLLAMSCLAAGCGPFDSLLGKEDNPGYCASPPCPPPDTNTCASNNDCMLPSVCDVSGSMQCVQCTVDQAAACTGVTPACDVNHTCRACASHAECPLSNACLPDGSCAAEAEVAYLDAMGTDNTTCSKAMPCTRVAKALATSRPYVKFHGTIDDTVAVGAGTTVTFLADPGATLTHSGGAAVLTVRDDGTSLAVHDLTISGGGNIGVLVALGSGEPTLSLTHTVVSDHSIGISVEAGTFMLTRSTIVNNGSGGIVIDGTATFSIIGNVFFANGGVLSTTGAARIVAIQSPVNRLEFNSFYKNQSRDGIVAIQCDAGIFTARNNIMFGNGTLTNQEQVSGSCKHVYTIVQPGTLPAGTGNIAVDPLFKDTVKGDLHLLSGSPAIGAADPNADLTGLAAHDLDGASRTRPATLGAYQMP